MTRGSGGGRCAERPAARLPPNKVVVEVAGDVKVRIWGCWRWTFQWLSDLKEEGWGF
jgi:hypothetical protein